MGAVNRLKLPNVQIKHPCIANISNRRELLSVFTPKNMSNVSSQGLKCCAKYSLNVKVGCSVIVFSTANVSFSTFILNVLFF